MAKRKTKKGSAAYKARMKQIRKIRRRLWDQECVYCGHDWHSAKTNAYVEKSKCCVQCMTYINIWCKRGAAAITKRLNDVQRWERRLSMGAGASSVRKERRALRAIAGGRP